MLAIRKIFQARIASLRAVGAKRAVAAAAAILLTVFPAFFSASRPVLSEDAGEEFGEVHWYQTEKSL